MKATVTKKLLSDSLGLLEKIIPNRSSNPLLTLLKVETTSSGLTLSGTNLEIDLSHFVPAEVSEEAAFVLPAHPFSQIIRSLNAEIVELELLQNELVVRANGSEFKLQLGELQAYPTLIFPENADLVLQGNEVAKALTNVRYAASSEMFQAVFRGVKLEHREETARVVASDGYRVAMSDFPIRGSGKDMIIPARSIDEIVRIIKDTEVKFTFGEGILSIATDSTKMNTKLLDGEYPNYEGILPKETQMKIKLDANKLKESVSRVAVLVDKTSNYRIDFIISEGKLIISAEGSYGRAQDTLDVIQTGELPINLPFNARHVIDALRPVEGEVEIQFAETASPVILRPENSEEGYTAVLISLRL